MPLHADPSVVVDAKPKGPARLELALLDPQVAGEIGVGAAHHLGDEPLCILAPHERLDGVAKRAGSGEGVVEDGVDDDARMMTVLSLWPIVPVRKGSKSAMS